jgi:hypothetical protein
MLQHELAGNTVELHVMEFLMFNSLFLFTFSFIISGL